MEDDSATKVQDVQHPEAMIEDISRVTPQGAARAQADPRQHAPVDPVILLLPAFQVSSLRKNLSGWVLLWFRELI